MRALCRACLRPRLDHARPRHYSYAPVRRTTFAPSRRKLTFCDAFTILLAPVLTTAFVFDATAKDRKCKEWDRQIAEVQRQTDELEACQQQRWLHVQRHSIHHGATIQRRMYSSQARALRPHLNVDESTALPNENKPAGESELPISLPDAVGALDGQALHSAQLAVQRFNHLLAMRLALHLTLQLRTGRAAIYQLSSNDTTYDLPFSVNLERLMNQLESVNRRIHDLRIKQYPHDLAQPQSYRTAQLKAAAEFNTAIENFQAGSINLPGLITAYSAIVSQHQCGLPLDTYVKLHRKLFRFRHMALCAITESAVVDCHQSLNIAAVSAILRRCARTADAYRLQEFLTRAVKHNHHPRLQVPWVERRFQGIRLCMPADSNGDLLVDLIYATTHCQQTHLAEAYANYMFQNDADVRVRGRHVDSLFSRLFQHFSFSGDWNRGQQWMNNFIAWAHRALDLRVVLLRMLELCVACDRQQEYNALLNIIVRFGIQPPTTYLDKPALFSPRITDIKSDWKQQLLELKSSPVDIQTLQTKQTFQRELRSWQLSLNDSTASTIPHKAENYLQEVPRARSPQKRTNMSDTIIPAPTSEQITSIRLHKDKVRSQSQTTASSTSKASISHPLQAVSSNQHNHEQSKSRTAELPSITTKSREGSDSTPQTPGSNIWRRAMAQPPEADHSKSRLQKPNRSESAVINSSNGTSDAYGSQSLAKAQPFVPIVMSQDAHVISGA